MNAFTMLDNEPEHPEQFVINYRQINGVNYNMFLYGWFDDNWRLIL